MDKRTIRLYEETEAECSDLYGLLHARGRHRGGLIVPDAGTIEYLAQKCAALGESVRALPAPSGAYAALKSHMGDLARAMEREARQMGRDPTAAMRIAARPLLRAERPGEDDEILRAASRIGEVWSAVKEWIGDVPPALLRRSAYSLRSTADAARHAALPDGPLKAAAEAAAEKLCACADDAERAAAGRADDPRCMDRDEYRDLLDRELGVDPDELLKWGDTEYEATREACLSLARSTAAAAGEREPRDMREVSGLLNRRAGPCASPEEMFARAKEYMALTRKLAHSILPLPDDEECLIAQVPYALRHSFPWGGYSDGDEDARPLRGRMFLNGGNFRAVTDGWIRINCLHEAYPGHHVQFVRRAWDDIPGPMRLEARNVPLMEGMCHRTETAYAHVYGDAPFYALFAACRRHHTAVRVRADLMLYRDGAGAEDAARLYREEMGFDEGTARGQVQAQLDMPGYFTCYCYGLKRIEKMEKESGMERDGFTRLLFSWSAVSLDTFRTILSLTEEERRAAPLKAARAEE